MAEDMTQRWYQTKPYGLMVSITIQKQHIPGPGTGFRVIISVFGFYFQNLLIVDHGLNEPWAEA
jgi:hypothetical protein